MPPPPHALGAHRGVAGAGMWSWRAGQALARMELTFQWRETDSVQVSVNLHVTACSAAVERGDRWTRGNFRPSGQGRPPRGGEGHSRQQEWQVRRPSARNGCVSLGTQREPLWLELSGLRWARPDGQRPGRASSWLREAIGGSGEGHAVIWRDGAGVGARSQLDRRCRRIGGRGSSD